MSTTARADAKRLLNHYIEFASSRHRTITPDNVAEIDSIVDLIVDAACEAVLERLQRGRRA